MTLDEMCRNFNLRFDRIEQFLPTLATKEQLQALRAEMATKEDLQALRAETATKEDLQALATKAELQALRAEMATKEDLKGLATKEDLQALATKEELHGLRLEVREGDAETRRYMKMLVEDVRSDISLLAEHLAGQDERCAGRHAEAMAACRKLDRRTTALEASRRTRRR